MTQNPPTELMQAIEQLYDAFASVPKPEQIDGCPCCINEREIETLLHKPRRELTSRDLGPIWGSCPFTVGDWHTFSYYLPRLIELIPQSGSYTDIESIFSRIGQHSDLLNPQQWKAAEDFLLAYLDQILLSGKGDTDSPDSLLAAAALCGLSLEPLLQYWLQLDDLTAQAHLADFIYYHGQKILEGSRWNSFLKDDALTRANDELTAWFQQPALAAALQEFQNRTAAAAGCSKDHETAYWAKVILSLE